MLKHHLYKGSMPYLQTLPYGRNMSSVVRMIARYLTAHTTMHIGRKESKRKQLVQRIQKQRPKITARDSTRYAKPFKVKYSAYFNALLSGNTGKSLAIWHLIVGLLQVMNVTFIHSLLE